MPLTRHYSLDLTNPDRLIERIVIIDSLPCIECGYRHITVKDTIIPLNVTFTHTREDKPSPFSTIEYQLDHSGTYHLSECRNYST